MFSTCEPGRSYSCTRWTRQHYSSICVQCNGSQSSNSYNSKEGWAWQQNAAIIWLNTQCYSNGMKLSYYQHSYCCSEYLSNIVLNVLGTLEQNVYSPVVKTLTSGSSACNQIEKDNGFFLESLNSISYVALAYFVCKIPYIFSLFLNTFQLGRCPVSMMADL